MGEHRRRQQRVTVRGQPLGLRQSGWWRERDVARHQRPEEISAGCRNMVGLQNADFADEFERLFDITSANTADLEVAGALGNLVGGFCSAHVAIVALTPLTLQSLQIRAEGANVGDGTVCGRAVQWWSFHRPTWTVIASWERPRLVELEHLNLDHPAVVAAAKSLNRPL
ncbi:MAG: hypothetical protein QOJ80_6380 [Mycobacterium sp.]|jgi:hypothetical protein|nr:hypothetical protein [Mycobacterium sp.]